MNKNSSEVYESLPPEVKVKMLEAKISIMLKMISDVDINIQRYGIMKKGSMSYNDFYSKYYLIFPGKKDVATSKG